MIGGRTRTRSRKGGRRTRRGGMAQGSMLAKAAVPFGLTGALLASAPRRGRRGKNTRRRRGGRKSRRA